VNGVYNVAIVRRGPENGVLLLPMRKESVLIPRTSDVVGLPRALFLVLPLSSQLIIAITLILLSLTPPASARNAHRKNVRANLRVLPTLSPLTIVSMPMVAQIVPVVFVMMSVSTLYSTAAVAGPCVLMASVAYVRILTHLIAAVLPQTPELAVMGV
jgi:hypothetical protein